MLHGLSKILLLTLIRIAKIPRESQKGRALGNFKTRTCLYYRLSITFIS